MIPAPYILIIVFLGILAYLTERYSEEKKSTMYLTLVGIISFTVFFAFRGFIFHDWMNYYPEFEKMDFTSLSIYEFGNLKFHEPGWTLFILLCKNIVDSYHFFIFVITLVEMTLFCMFLRKYSDNILLSLVVFLAFDGFSSMSNLLRNMIAILIFLNALPFIERKQPLKYFALCLLAFCFHFSSVLFLPLYFFLNKRINKYMFLGIALTCSALFVLQLPIVLSILKHFNIVNDFVQTKLEVYTEMTERRGIGLGFIERLFTTVLIFCYYNRIMERKESNVMFVNGFLLYLMTFSFLSEFDEIAKRFSILFLFSYWILWPEMRRCFSIGTNRQLFSLFLGLYCVIKVLTTVNHPVMEYDNLLFGNIKSYEERKYIFQKTFDDN